MNGVPFDVAHALDDVQRMAYAITFQELNPFGGKPFNWDRMRFEE